MRKALTMGMALAFVAFSATAAFAAGQVAAEPEGPMEITWMGLYAHNVQEGNPIQTLLEEKFDVKFINVFAEYQEQEANSLRVAADEHPEAMYNWGYDRLEFYLKGAFRTIPRSMIEEHMPNYTASMNNLGAGSWYYGLAPGKSDEYYALPRREDYAANCGRLYTIRHDYIESVAPELLPETLNADIMEDLAPTTAPGHFLRWLDHYTWEQLGTLIHALATGDPDGNGRNDTVAVGIMGELPWDHTWGAGLAFNPHGIYGVDNYPEPDGSTVWIDTSSRSLAALKVLRGWFQAGYIDGELPAVNRQQVQTQIVEGRVAISGRPASVVTQNCGRRLEIGGRAQICNTAVDENPNTRFVTVLPPLGPDGTTTCRQRSLAMPLNAVAGGFTVRHDVSDETLARILQIYDYANFDPEGMVITYFGIPGEDFEWAGEPWNSRAVRTTLGDTDQSARGILYYNAYSRPSELERYGYDEQGARDYADFRVPGGKYAGLSPYAYREDIFQQTQYAVLRAQSRSALNTLRDEFFWKALTTDLDIDAEWPGYVDGWMNAGGREMLAELEKAPTVADIRAGRVTPP